MGPVTRNPKEIAAWLVGVSDDIVDGADKAVLDSTEETKARAVERAPGKSRKMARSIISGIRRQGPVTVGFVTSPLAYAQYTEIRGRNRNIPVGTAQRPTTQWPAKRERGGSSKESMPWLSAAQADTGPKFFQRSLAALRGK